MAKLCNLVIKRNFEERKEYGAREYHVASVTTKAIVDFFTYTRFPTFIIVYYLITRNITAYTASTHVT